MPGNLLQNLMISDQQQHERSRYQCKNKPQLYLQQYLKMSAYVRVRKYYIIFDNILKHIRFVYNFTELLADKYLIKMETETLNHQVLYFQEANNHVNDFLRIIIIIIILNKSKDMAPRSSRNNIIVQTHYYLEYTL